MKCSNCGNEMVHSRAGYLCISCGHIEPHDSSASQDLPTAATSTVPAPDPPADPPTSDTPAEPAADAPSVPSAVPTDPSAPADSSDEAAPASDATATDASAGDSAESSTDAPTGPSSDAPAESTPTDAPAEDVTPPAPVAAAPWEAPDSSATPNSDSSTTPDATEPAASEAAEPEPDKPEEPAEPAVPAAPDLKAVEEALAKATGGAPSLDAEKPAEEEKSDEPKAKESKAEEPTESKPDDSDAEVAAVATGIASVTKNDELSEPSIIHHHKVKRHPKHKKDDDEATEKDKADEDKAGKDEPQEEHEESTGKHDDLKLEVPEEKPQDDAEPKVEVPESEAEPEPEAKAEPDESVSESTPEPPEVPSAPEPPEPEATPEPEPESPAEPPAEDKPNDDLSKLDEDTANAQPQTDEPKEDEPEDDEPKVDAPVSSSVVIPPGPDAATTPTEPLPAQPIGESGAIAVPVPAADEPGPVPGTLEAAAAAAAVPAAAPINGKPPLNPATHPRPFNAKLVIGLVAGVVLAAAASGVGYMYTVSPQAALAGYLQKVVDSKTANFVATSTSATEDYRVALKLYGSGDVSNPDDPKFDVQVTGEVSADKPLAASESSPGGTLAGHAIMVGQTFYFKIENLSALSSILPVKLSKDWYKLSAGKTESNQCGQTAAFSAALRQNVLAAVPVKDAKFAGFDNLEGTQALRYTGTVDNAKLQSLIDAANANLTDECKLDATADDYKNQTTKYELWRGWSRDRLKLTTTDSSTGAVSEVTLDTSNYNQSVTITAPEGAKDAAELFEGVTVLGASTKPASKPVVESATTSSLPDYDANNAQRQAHLALYAEAYKAKAKNGYYPVALPEVSVKATDPTTGKPYVVSKSQPVALGQIEYRPGGSCTGPGKTPGATGTRYLSIYVFLEGEDPLYCLDVK